MSTSIVEPNAKTNSPPRLAALQRFAVAISLLTLIGHQWLGLEQSWIQVGVVLVVAHGVEWILQRLEGSPGVPLINWRRQLPAHIVALSVALLLYAGSALWPFALAVLIGLVSKRIFILPPMMPQRHFFNPSNIGISIVLLFYNDTVGIAPPYQFTENLGRTGSILLPLLFICTGTFINARLTNRLPLILAWLGGFGLQSGVQALLNGAPLLPKLSPMTGVAFLLFTFYMITDPATTPNSRRGQIVFGAGVAAAYGVLVWCHIVFGMFFGLALVCAARGCTCWLVYLTAVARRTYNKKQAYVEYVPA